VFDEVFRGTNPDDALDITRATLSGPTHFPNAVFFISTHPTQIESPTAGDASAAVGCYRIEGVLTEGTPVFFFNPSAAGRG